MKTCETMAAKTRGVINLRFNQDQGKINRLRKQSFVMLQVKVDR